MLRNILVEFVQISDVSKPNLLHAELKIVNLCNLSLHIREQYHHLKVACTPSSSVAGSELKIVFLSFQPQVTIRLTELSLVVSHPTDSQQPVAEPRPRRPRGLLLHAASRLPSLRHLLPALPSFGRRRR